MTASAHIQASTRNPFSDGLIACGFAGWSVILVLTWVMSKEVAVPLSVATVALGIVGLMVSRPVAVLYVLTALGPFYDMSRAFFFPGSNWWGSGRTRWWRFFGLRQYGTYLVGASQN